jgi:hypothetical protein
MWHVLLSVGDIIIAEKDPIIRRQGTAGKRKHNVNDSTEI